MASQPSFAARFVAASGSADAWPVSHTPIIRWGLASAFCAAWSARPAPACQAGRRKRSAAKDDQLFTVHFLHLVGGGWWVVAGVWFGDSPLRPTTHHLPLTTHHSPLTTHHPPDSCTRNALVLQLPIIRLSLLSFLLLVCL